MIQSELNREKKKNTIATFLTNKNDLKVVESLKGPRGVGENAPRPKEEKKVKNCLDTKNKMMTNELWANKHHTVIMRRSKIREAHKKYEKEKMEGKTDKRGNLHNIFRKRHADL